ncbi:MAG TPA: glycosyltransferase family 2 protein [Gammaproteobacteria bacterium]|nr:glycosyltransferase family 2 protein [Gammaproteobacteria bacterium]
MHDTKLSVIIVTKNEAHNIRACLESIAFANEVILYDCGSTDGTPEIALQYTQKVTVTKDWPGDGPQKNRALKDATQDWVLCLDADERVSSLLAQEIQETIPSTPYDAFSIPFHSYYCGHLIRFGAWRGERHVRLFKRQKGRFTEDKVHCHLQVLGKTGKLKQSVLHYPFHHLGSMLHKLNDYSTQSAASLFQAGKKASLFTAISHGFWAFFQSYFLKFGFLDGKEGFILAVSNGQGTYYRYLKLMYLTENAKKHV